jgi:hypothetical protein
MQPWTFAWFNIIQMPDIHNIFTGTTRKEQEALDKSNDAHGPVHYGAQKPRLLLIPIKA